MKPPVPQLKPSVPQLKPPVPELAPPAEPSGMLGQQKIIDEYDPSRPNDYEELVIERERIKKQEADERRAKKGAFARLSVLFLQTRAGGV